MKRAFWLIAAALIIPLLFAALLLPGRLEPWAENEIREAIQSRCATCTFTMRELRLHWRGVNARDVEFTGGVAGGQRVQAKIASVLIVPELMSVFSKKPRLRAIHLLEPKVVFYDGPKRTPKTKGQGGDTELPADIHRMFIRDGAFSYIRDVKDTHAELHVTDIRGAIDPDPDLFRAWITARIGRGGSVELKVTSPLKKKPLELISEINLQDQNLEDLSHFFKPNAGVELKGVMTRASGVTHVQGRTQTAKVFAEFKDFSLKVNPMYDRDDVTTFFTNLGTAVAMRSKNTAAPRAEKTETKSLNREAGESLVSFILRGLKEAAIDITI